jgi:hypothetical protein
MGVSVRNHTSGEGSAGLRTMNGRHDVGRKHVRVDEVGLRLKVLDDLERAQGELVPGLVPFGVKLGRPPVRRQDLGVVILRQE